MTTLETSAPATSAAVTTGALGGLAGVGCVVHIAISAILGAGFGVLAKRRVHNLATGIGPARRTAWWVLGALVLMPLRLDIDLFRMNSTTMKSLKGHLIFGMVLGAVVAARVKR